VFWGGVKGDIIVSALSEEKEFGVLHPEINASSAMTAGTSCFIGWVILNDYKLIGQDYF